VPGIARVHVEAWRRAYVGIVPQEHLDALSTESYERRWTESLAEAVGRTDWFCSVAVREQSVVGFVEGGRARKPHGGCLGEIYSLYVVPACWREGIGRLLVARALQTLRERALVPVCVSTLRDNAFRHFYEKLGAEVIGADVFPVAKVELPVVVYRWPS
jgi:GNAT superfamily N-acetyltransferase